MVVIKSFKFKHLLSDYRQFSTGHRYPKTRPFILLYPDLFLKVKKRQIHIYTSSTSELASLYVNELRKIPYILYLNYLSTAISFHMQALKQQIINLLYSVNENRKSNKDTYSQEGWAAEEKNRWGRKWGMPILYISKVKKSGQSSVNE